MPHLLALKNSAKKVIVSNRAYHYLNNHAEYKRLQLLNNLRMHSYGYAFFQKNERKKEGGYKNTTIYLHRCIAEQFIKQPPTNKRLLISFKNGNRLDCQEKNLYWTTSSKIVRNIAENNSYTGYRGVSKVNNKYRAIIFKNQQRYDLGMYNTAEEAAYIYNKKSEAWFGITKSLNKLSHDTIKKYDFKYKS